jgi:hypothetical protein
MLTIFNFCYDTVNTVLSLRMLNKRFHKIAGDPYIQDNFVKNNYNGVFIEIRGKHDIEQLRKAIIYSEIINATSLLNCNVY